MNFPFAALLQLFAFDMIVLLPGLAIAADTKAHDSSTTPLLPKSDRPGRPRKAATRRQFRKHGRFGHPRGGSITRSPRPWAPKVVYFGASQTKVYNSSRPYVEERSLATFKLRKSHHGIRNPGNSRPR